MKLNNTAADAYGQLIYIKLYAHLNLMMHQQKPTADTKALLTHRFKLEVQLQKNAARSHKLQTELQQNHKSYPVFPIEKKSDASAPNAPNLRPNAVTLKK